LKLRFVRLQFHIELLTYASERLGAENQANPSEGTGS